jgi:hypothetical protein
MGPDGIVINYGGANAQSRQRLSFFSSRRNWDSPNPSPAGKCALPPSPVLGGGAHSLARKGLGESQFRRGDIHCGTLYIYVLCGQMYAVDGPNRNLQEFPS